MILLNCDAGIFSTEICCKFLGECVRKYLKVLQRTVFVDSGNFFLSKKISRFLNHCDMENTSALWFLFLFTS